MRSGFYDENGNLRSILYQYDDVDWNETHFSSNIRERMPNLQYMKWVPPGFNLSGSPISESEYNSIIALFSYEYQSSCPITFEDYIDKIDYSTLYLVISNENFYPSDMENPIRTVINDDYNYYFSPKEYNRYILNVQKNSYEIETGSLFSQK